MHLIYVDESGDDGLNNSNIYKPLNTPTRFYIKTALITHDWKWKSNQKKIQKFRKSINLPKNVEIHATVINRGKIKKWRKGKRAVVSTWWSTNYPIKKDRKKLLKSICKTISKLDITLLYVAIDKANLRKSKISKNTIKNISWEYLIERINLFISEQRDKCGMIISDAIEYNIEKEHRNFVKALHQKSDHIEPKQFIETILFEPSESSDFLQMVDVCAYAMNRKLNCQDDYLLKTIEKKIFENDLDNKRNSGLKIWPE